MFSHDARKADLRASVGRLSAEHIPGLDTIGVAWNHDEGHTDVPPWLLALNGTRSVHDVRYIVENSSASTRSLNDRFLDRPWMRTDAVLVRRYRSVPAEFAGARRRHGPRCDRADRRL